MWGGRFEHGVDKLMEAFNQSLSYDKRMYKADIRGSQAYAKGLVVAGVLVEEERKVGIHTGRATNDTKSACTCIQAIHDGLDKVLQEWEEGEFVEQSADEDIHMANERRLAELIGPVAGTPSSTAVSHHNLLTA